MYKPDRKIVRKELFKIINTQMRDGNPPETGNTYHRLRSQGYSKEETMKLIACVLLNEINEMVKENRVFDEPAFSETLRALPRLPWEDE